MLMWYTTNGYIIDALTQEELEIENILLKRVNK